MELATACNSVLPEPRAPACSGSQPYLEGMGVLAAMVALTFCPNLQQAPSRAAAPPDDRLSSLIGAWTVSGITQRPGRDDALRLTCTGEWLARNRVVSLTYRSVSGAYVMEQWLSYNSERSQWTCRTFLGRRRGLAPSWSMPRGDRHTLHLLGSLPNPLSGAPETLHSILVLNSRDTFRLSWSILAPDGTPRSILRLDHQRLDHQRLDHQRLDHQRTAAR